MPLYRDEAVVLRTHKLGEADRIVWTSLHSRSLEREIPTARLVVLPGIGRGADALAPVVTSSVSEGFSSEEALPSPQTNNTPPASAAD